MQQLSHIFAAPLARSGAQFGNRCPKLLYKREILIMQLYTLPRLQQLQIVFLLLKVYQNDQKIKKVRAKFVF